MENHQNRVLDYQRLTDDNCSRFYAEFDANALVDVDESTWWACFRPGSTVLRYKNNTTDGSQLQREFKRQMVVSGVIGDPSIDQIALRIEYPADLPFRRLVEGARQLLSLMPPVGRPPLLFAAQPAEPAFRLDLLAQRMNR